MIVAMTRSEEFDEYAGGEDKELSVTLVEDSCAPAPAAALAAGASVVEGQEDVFGGSAIALLRFFSSGLGATLSGAPLKPVGDLATQLFGSDGTSDGYDNKNQAHTAKSQACVSLK